VVILKVFACKAVELEDWEQFPLDDRKQQALDGQKVREEEQ